MGSLRLYRAYKRGWVQLSWKLFIYVDLFLAFIEPPYTITPPFEGLSAVLEVICMIALLAELVVRFQFLERRAFFRSPKIITQILVITATLADVMLSSATGNTLRLTRYLRPWWLFYSSRLLRTATNTIRRIVFSLFDLLLLILLAIILFGSVCAVIFAGSHEGHEYFPDLFTAYINLYFGLYSLNYPDIMIPAYHASAWWSLLFIGYVLVVSWFLMAIVLATIYTVYKSGLKGEVAQVLYHQHQRLAAAWQLFGCHVSGKLSWPVWEQLFAVLKPHYRPEKVRRHGVPYPGQGPKGLPPVQGVPADRGPAHVQAAPDQCQPPHIWSCVALALLLPGQQSLPQARPPQVCVVGGGFRDRGERGGLVGRTAAAIGRR
jgi:hypothetical protein